MKYLVQRIVTAVQWAYVEASTAEDAAEEAKHNPQLLQWQTSSENDPIIDVVREQA